MVCVQKMNVGDISEVIKTKSGYKIVCLVDMAEAGRVAKSKATYKFMKASITYRDKFFTQKDRKTVEKTLEKISKLENIGDLKKCCLEANIPLSEEVVDHPDPYYAEIITKSKTSGKPVIAQSMEEADKLNVIMFESEAVANEQLPSDKELSEIISAKKMNEAFMKNFKKLKAMVHISKNAGNIKRMLK